MVTVLRVPDQHRSALIQLTKLDSDQMARLTTALAGAGPAPRDVERAIDQAVKDADAQLFAALVSLTTYRIAHDTSAADAAAQVLEALGEEAGKSDLAAVLSAPRLVALAKAFDLAITYEKKLHSFRVVTDLRPIFGEDPTVIPTEYLLQHQLEISHYRDGEIETMIVTIDPSDIDTLQKKLRRAVDKETALRRMIEESDGIIVDPSEGGL